MSIRQQHSLLRGALVACACLLLGACGVGSPADSVPPGGVEGGETSALTITTAALPAASEGEPFPSTQLTVENAGGPVTWSLGGGALPPGLALSGEGMVSGTPTAKGYFSFNVLADDGTASDTQDLGIAVDTLAMLATTGLMAGDAWTTTAITLTATGQTGSVTFSILASESGGFFTGENPTTGTATWITGSTGGVGVTDTLRVTEPTTGNVFDLSLDVMTDPTETHTASFGSTDVWWIDPTPKSGGHPYTTDLHAALVDVGFRAPASTAAPGTRADQLAETWIRVELLRRLNPMFLRNADGTAGAQGLPISFPFAQPGGGYTTPSPAGILPGSSTRYSLMALIDGTSPGIIGTAFVDTTTNARHENDTTSGSFELGVFANQIASVFNAAYSNSLQNDPINAGDVDALRALLYQLPNPGGRYNTLKSMGEGFARTVAAVTAHEIGHSLGLEHTSPTTPGSIMNAGATIGPSATYSFTAGALSQLGGALPGVGRSTSSLSLKAGHPSVAAGGVRVCNCRHEPLRK